MKIIKRKERSNIGIDVKNVVLYMAHKKVLSNNVSNVKLLPFNIKNIEEVLIFKEINLLFISFPDPWLKARYTKRRLTNSRFLKEYKNILKDDSLMILKADNRPLFDYSTEELLLADFDIVDITCDLANEKDKENILTEYEIKFINKGVKINRLISKKLIGLGVRLDPQELPLDFIFNLLILRS